MASIDGVDVLGFVDSIIPVSAEPATGVGGIDVATQTFLAVRAGTLLLYRIELRNDVVAPGVGPQTFRLELLFRGDGRTFIDRQIVEIVVPGTDGPGCPPMIP